MEDEDCDTIQIERRLLAQSYADGKSEQAQKLSDQAFNVITTDKQNTAACSASTFPRYGSAITLRRQGSWKG